MEVIARVRETSPDTEVVIITGKSSVETAIEAVRRGVCEYLTKPCRLADIQAVLERVRQRRELTLRLRALERRVRRAEGATQIVGESTALASVRRLVERVAKSDAAVLVRGETGTGKELVARAIHEGSSRADGPLVAVNCGALPEHLVESELFGHRKGAFTGADEHRAGLFEVADGGTLFLDEIGELPRSLQSRLLRVLESGEIRRVGDNHPITVDVRLVCATHRALETMATDGEFAKTCSSESTRSRSRCPRCGIEKTTFFPRRPLCPPRSPSKPPRAETIDDEALGLLLAHGWPGNIRELANVIEHALVLCDDLPVTAEHLPGRFRKLVPVAPVKRQADGPQLDRIPAASASPDRPKTLREMELDAILEGLERNGGNKPRRPRSSG